MSRVPSPTEFVETRRPAGGRRSGKRDAIVSVFLRQDGHLSAEELVDIIHREDARISRATIYRTLQWMVDAGIARRVDFGEGRFRFEHSYRHPRHFHLICKTCNQSSEFLSSDIETLLEEVAAARGFAPRQSVVQIYGTCENCRAGRPAGPSAAPTDAVFARDALRIAIATERSGLEFYTRAARLARDPRGREVFQKLAEEEKEHLGTLEARYRTLMAADPQLEAQPTFLFFKGAAQGLFAAGTLALTKGGADRQALQVGIRCERGSHQFFKRYGERFEESEGKRIFLEFADEERAHLELLIREYRALVARESRGDSPARTVRDPQTAARVIDLHLHTTASDGLLSPDELIREAASAGLTTIAVTDHDTVAGLAAAITAAKTAGIECVPGIEITAVHDGVDVHVLGYFFDADHPELHAFLTTQLDDRRRRLVEMTARLADLGVPVDVGTLDTAAHRDSRRSLGRPMIARALVEAGHVKTVQEAFDKYLALGRPAFMPRVGMAPADVFALIARAGGLGSLAHPVKLDEATMLAIVDAGIPALEVYHPDQNAKVTHRFRELATSRGLLVTGGSDFHGNASGRTNALGQVVLPRDDYDQTAAAAGWTPRP